MKKNVILFVDNDSTIIRQVKSELCDLPILYAKGVFDALDVIDNLPEDENLLLLITDLNMNDHNGDKLLYEVSLSNPETILTVISGASDITLSQSAIEKGIDHYFKKSVTIIDELGSYIIEKLDLSVSKPDEELRVSIESIAESRKLFFEKNLSGNSFVENLTLLDKFASNKFSPNKSTVTKFTNNSDLEISYRNHVISRFNENLENLSPSVILSLAVKQKIISVLDNGIVVNPSLYFSPLYLMSTSKSDWDKSANILSLCSLMSTPIDIIPAETGE